MGGGKGPEKTSRLDDDRPLLQMERERETTLAPKAVSLGRHSSEKSQPRCTQSIQGIH